MKKNLFNKFWLRVGMIVAIMTTALAGTAWAQVVTYKLTIDASYFNATSYAANNNEKTTNAVCTTDNTKTYEVKWTSNQVMLSSGKMQWQKNKGYIYNSTDLGTITNVTIDKYDGTFTTYYGTSTQPSSSTTVGGGYFQTKVGNATGSTHSIEITFQIEEGSTPPTPTYNVTYNANGGTGTMTDENSPYEEDDVVTLLTNTFTAPESMMWDSWVVKDADDNDVTVTNNQFTMPASNVTVTAQWVADPSAPQYEWVATDLADLTSSDIFVIVGDNGSTYAMPNNGGASSPTVSSVTIANNKITSVVSNNLKWNISGNATDGYIFYPNESTTTYLYCLDQNTGLRVGTGSQTYSNTFKMDVSGYLKTTVGSNTRYVGIYNSQDWRSYTSNGGNIANQTFAFYKRVDANASQTPSITISNNSELAYDATSGSFDFDINDPVTDGVTSVSESVDWISNATISGNSVTFTTTANEANTERTGTITLTYTYNTNETVTKDVTVTQAAAPVSYTTIPDLFAAATTTETPVYVTFNNWVVSGVSTNGKNVFVTDNAGNGFIIYDTNGGLNNTYSVGNILSGTAVACKVQKFNGSAEVTGLNASDLTITTGGSVTAANVAMASLAGVNTGALVSYENLTCSVDDSGSTTKYYLTDGTTSIQVYNSLFAFGALEAGKVYNITGVYQQFNSTKEILPRSADDIEEVEAPTTTTITAGTLTNVTINELYDGNMDDITLGESVAAGTMVYFTLSVETNYELQTVTVLDASNNEVTLTENQGSWSFTMPNSSVTINATAVQGSVTPVTGDKYVKVTSTDDLTDGQYLIVYEEGSVAFDGGLETLDAVGNTIEVTISNNEIAVTEATAAAEFTIDVTAGTIQSASGFYIGQTGDANGLASNKETEYKNTISISDGDADIVSSGGAYLRYNSASNQTRFRYYKSSSYTGQQAIQLYKKVEAPITVTVGDALYTTYVAPVAVSFPDDVTAYIVTSKTETAVTLTEKASVPAGTPVVVKATEAGTYALTTTTTPESVDGNLLLASDGNVQGGEGIYALSTLNGTVPVGFYPVGNDTNGNPVVIPAGKAYLYISGGNVKGYTFDFDDDATGISNLKDSKDLKDSKVIYNLAGQRLQKMQRGINIVNGKKILK